MKSTAKNENAINAKDSKWVYFKDWATAAFVSYLNDNNLKQRLYDRVFARFHERKCDRNDMFTEAYLEMNDRNDDFHNKLPDSSAKDYLDNYLKMIRKTDKDLDNLEKAFRLVGTSKYDEENYHRGWLRDGNEDKDNLKRPDSRSILDDIEPTSDLCKVNLELMEKYPMVRFMDDAHFGYRNPREAMEATLNYISMVEATYHTKKKIGEVKDKAASTSNIFSQVNA